MNNRLIPAFDCTITWNPQQGWHSANPDIMRTLTHRKYIDTTAQILKKMESDYRELGCQPQSFAERLHSRLWATKFNEQTTAIALIVGDYLSPLIRKVIPSCLASGIRIILCHTAGRTGNFKPVHNRQPKRFAEDGTEILPALDMAPAYKELSRIEDWLAIIRTNEQNLSDLQAEAARLLDTAEVFQLLPQSKGPITGAFQIRASLPPIAQMEYLVENLAPLYDMELPHPCFVREFENIARFNDSGIDSKHLRPNRTVHTQKIRQVQVEDYTEMIICYLQLRFYLAHRIRPVYLWTDVESDAPYYEDSSSDDDYNDDSASYVRRSRRPSASSEEPTRLLISECRVAGTRGRFFK